MPIPDKGPVAEYFAINLRKARETRGLSQADLAQKIKDLGHSCTQATIWKLEQGHREPKLTEAVAIGQALGLWSWTELTVEPEGFNFALSLDHWRAQVFESAERTRAAATAQIEALVNLAVVVREGLDAGESAEWLESRSGGWLKFTPEVTVLREVLAARVDWETEDEENDRRMDEHERLVEQIIRGLETAGVSLAVQPEDIKIVPAEPFSPEDGRHDGEETPSQGR